VVLPFWGVVFFENLHSLHAPFVPFRWEICAEIFLMYFWHWKNYLHENIYMPRICLLAIVQICEQTLKFVNLSCKYFLSCDAQKLL
jgi:hypothetical protein